MPKKTAPQEPEGADKHTVEIVSAFKGFNTDLSCRDHAYTIGETYRMDGDVRICERGFHACEHPLDVLRYYPPATSRFAIVELAGPVAREQASDSKIASASITIKAEIDLPDLIKAAVKYVTDRVRWTGGTMASGEGEGARCDSTGGAATASGWRGAATASGTRGAATASGDGGAATASGWRGAATASGYDGKARGAAGCAIFLVERQIDGKILHVYAGLAGTADIKPDTYYKLVDGRPIEAD